MTDFSIHGEVAVIEVNHGPVNKLNTKVQLEIFKRIVEANRNWTVKAIVICGKGKTFPVGADIKELETLTTMEKETIMQRSEVRSVRHVEISKKPVVAAIHGYCLGLGLELAMASHFRISVPSAKLGLPEVRLGLIPGNGGTQRLPRLVGIQKALEMLLTGSSIKATDALQMGLIDKIANTADIKEAGIAFANEVISQGLETKVTSEQPVPDAAFCKEIIDGAYEMVQKKLKGQMGPIFCIKSAEASVTSPTFEAGVKREREIFNEALTSTQAKALIYAFFAERAAQKWELSNGINSSVVIPRPVKTGAVIGGGTMGSGIAVCMLNAGIPITLVEQNQKFLDKGLETIRHLYQGSVKLGRMSQEEADKCLSLLKSTLHYGDLSSIDIVIEAVYENMELKKKIFTQLNRVCKSDALLCTNTSSLDIDEISSATSCPDRVIGAHFFVPSYYMPLLEVVKGKGTSTDTIATTFAYAKKIGKKPVLVKNAHGFVGNKMMEPYILEARFVIEEGALPHQVDQAIEGYGFPLGPFKVGDLSGLDIGWNINKEYLRSRGIPYVSRRRSLLGARYSPLVDQLCELGRFGRKTGAGWYKYEKPGGKKPMVDPFVNNFIEKFCQEEGIKTRNIETEEIIERCLYALINEGFKLLDEGIAYKPQDIDAIWIFGYGWPSHTGGPMFYARQIGLKKMYDRICHYRNAYPTTPHWEPCSLLARLATRAPDAPMDTWTKFRSKL